MNCLNCRKPNDNDARFCYDCGTVLPPSFEDSDSSSPTVAAYNSGSRSKDNRVDPLIGRTLDNRYRLESKLGSGGMGTVYVATRLSISDTVAVKVLRLGESGDPHSAERFRREARTTAGLKHPNAVSVYDFGTTADGLHYLVMELVEGQDLRSIIKQQGPLSASMTLDIITQVCAALEEAHRQNIIHRDIKPDNIIVNTSANRLHVKVLDFGVAKLCDLSATNITQSGSVMGTPHYMSPEQCLGEVLDTRADIYSLGVVLYEMLCGVVPFNAPSSTAVVVQHVNQLPPPPRTKNVSITPAIEAVMLHALEKRREARPQTAGALAQELTAAIYGRAPAEIPRPTPVHNPPVTSPDVAYTPGMASAMFTSTPASGNRFMPPASGPQHFSGQAATASPNRNFYPLVLVAALLLLIVGGTIVATALLMGKKDELDQTTSSAQTRPASDKDRAPGASTAQQPATISAADAEFITLSERRHHATEAQHAEVAGALRVAEAKYPTDYRFPYEHAKMEVNDPPPHDEVIELLFTAGQKAIDAGKANEMLRDLVEEENHEFRGFSGEHRQQWTTLIEALKNRDKSALKAEHSH